MDKNTFIDRVVDSPVAKVKLFGNFGLKVYDHSLGVPQLKLRIRKKNQVTNQGRSVLLNLFCPSTNSTDPEQDQLWVLAAGSNSTPAAATDNDSTMTIEWQDSFYTIPVGAYPPPVSTEAQVIANPPSDFYIQVTKTMPKDAIPNTTLTEAGIFTRGTADDWTTSTGRKLYARKTHTPIEKTGDMTIEYRWQLGITIQGD